MTYLERRCIKCDCLMGYKDAKTGEEVKKTVDDTCVGITNGICEVCSFKRKIEKLTIINDALKIRLEEAEIQARRWKNYCTHLMSKSKIGWGNE